MKRRRVDDPARALPAELEDPPSTDDRPGWLAWAAARRAWRLGHGMDYDDAGSGLIDDLALLHTLRGAGVLLAVADGETWLPMEMVP